MKITITWVGQPKDIQTKFGPKQKFSIKTQEHGENYLDVWSSPTTKDWKVGQTVEVESVAEREYNGKTYYEVKMPKFSGGANQADINSIKTTLVNLTVQLTTVENLVRKLGRLYEEKNNVIVTKDAIIPKSMEEIAQEEFDGPDYPENNLDEAFPNEE